MLAPRLLCFELQQIKFNKFLFDLQKTIKDLQQRHWTPDSWSEVDTVA